MKHNGLNNLREAQRKPDKRLNSEGKLNKENALQYSYSNISFSKYQPTNKNNTIGSLSVGRNFGTNSGKTVRENGFVKKQSASKLTGLNEIHSPNIQQQKTSDPYAKPLIPLHSLPRVKKRLYYDEPMSNQHPTGMSNQIPNQSTYNNMTKSPRVIIKNDENLNQKRTELKNRSMFENKSDGEQNNLPYTFTQPQLKGNLTGIGNFGSQSSGNQPNKQYKLASMLNNDKNFETNNNHDINQAINSSNKKKRENSQMDYSKYRQKKNLFINGTNTISNNLKLTSDQIPKFTGQIDIQSLDNNIDLSLKGKLPPNPISKRTPQNSIGGVVYFDKVEKAEKSEQEKSKRKDTSSKNLFIVGTRSKGGHSGATPKTNQDSWVVEFDYMGINDAVYAAVFDGHGTQGHKASGYLKIHTQKNLDNFLKRKQLGFLNGTSTANDSNTSSLVRSALVESFHYTNDELNKNKNIFTDLSGSTGVAILLQNGILYCANVGDSKCVIVTNKEETNSAWKVVELSREHHPTLPEERARIEKSGGRVEAFKMPNGNPIGPLRIWKKFEDAPGQMMSRTFGDRMGHACGIICTPEIFEYKMGSDVKAIVLGSDGVFEVLSSSVIMSIVTRHYPQRNSDAAAEEQLEKSIVKWRNKANYQDDITCVVLYLNESAYEDSKNNRKHK